MFVESVKNNRQKQCFGWCHATHKRIDERLIEKYNHLFPKDSMKYTKEFLVELGSIHPDYDRKKFTQHIHGHFANIDNLSKNPPDAYHLALKYTNKAIEAHKNGDYTKRDLYTGYATHFITDALQPYHAIPFEYQGKTHPVRKAHRYFEIIAKRIQESVFKNAVLDDIDTQESSFFNEIFPNAMRKAKNMFSKIKGKNYKNTVEVATEALNNTYNTMNIYFKMLTQKLIEKVPAEEAA